MVNRDRMHLEAKGTTLLKCPYSIFEANLYKPLIGPRIICIYMADIIACEFLDLQIGKKVQTRMKRFNEKRLNQLPFDPANNNEPLQFGSASGPLVTEGLIENGGESSKKRKRTNTPSGKLGDNALS
ncbi:hypothetical protein P7K49_039078 [Saguinus oedipus]|uniref:Uncharacterized protein n=1 Tax=Saguinus oedipus TaxID=9490 RepID=A0ABQ9TI12_SAGOE|nr:hypothetical protein P7K49_039078 [Saguinus oedipus]